MRRNTLRKGTRDMFWNKFILLCNKNGVSPNEVCKGLGLSNATATKWKSGALPRDTTLTKISEYFGVTVGFFTDGEDAASIVAGNLTEHETNVLLAYRAQPEMQLAVDKLLGVETVRVYMAASSKENHPDTIIDIEKKRWDELKNAPETDDSLL